MEKNHLFFLTWTIGINSKVQLLKLKLLNYWPHYWRKKNLNYLIIDRTKQKYNSFTFGSSTYNIVNVNLFLNTPLFILMYII